MAEHFGAACRPSLSSTAPVRTCCPCSRCCRAESLSSAPRPCTSIPTRRRLCPVFVPPSPRPAGRSAPGVSTQTIELGTAYQPTQVRAIADHVQSHGMVLHVGEARISYAAATPGVGLADFTSAAGVNLLSFGGTKDGLLFGQAVVVMIAEKGPRRRVTTVPARAQHEVGQQDEVRLRSTGGAAQATCGCGRRSTRPPWLPGSPKV